jgi:hypothetical protein
LGATGKKNISEKAKKYGKELRREGTMLYRTINRMSAKLKLTLVSHIFPSYRCRACPMFVSSCIPIFDSGFSIEKNLGSRMLDRNTICGAKSKIMSFLHIKKCTLFFRRHYTNA